ncbi:hypothetical protein [Streptomyces sp. NPDC002265]|uniref:hypothetical protein n=1 Tax=Streptomyces sp. NPDC002265 TaxID=3154415 RepID=UPI00332013B7
MRDTVHTVADVHSPQHVCAAVRTRASSAAARAPTVSPTTQATELREGLRTDCAAVAHDQVQVPLREVHVVN